MSAVVTQPAPTAQDAPHAATGVVTGIDQLSGHQARALLHRLVDDLTAHPDELGNAVAVLRTIERALPRPA